MTRILIVGIIFTLIGAIMVFVFGSPPWVPTVGFVLLLIGLFLLYIYALNRWGAS